MSSRVIVVGLVASFGVAGLADAQSNQTNLKHNGQVYAVAYSTDGKRLAAGAETADKTGEAIVWDVAVGKQLMQGGGYASAVVKVGFSSGGRILAASSADHLALWDMPSGKLRQKIPGAHFLDKHGIGVLRVSMPSWELRGGVIHRTGLDGKGLKTWRSDTNYAQRLALSADGERLAMVVPKRTWHAVVVDVGEMKTRHVFPLHDFTEAHALTLSPDNKVLAVGTSADASLWDVPTGRLRAVLVCGKEGDGEADT